MIKKIILGITSLAIVVGVVSCKGDECSTNSKLEPKIIVGENGDKKFEYDYSEQIVNIPISTGNGKSCNMKVTSIADNDDITWLTDNIFSDKVADGVGLNFKLPKHTDENNQREAKILFTLDGTEPVEVVFTQHKLIPVIKVADNTGGDDFVFSARGGSDNLVYVETNNGKEVLITVEPVNVGEDVSWVKLSYYGANEGIVQSGENFLFTILANTDIESDREAKLIFNSENAEKKEVIITQKKQGPPTELSIEGVVMEEDGSYKLNAYKSELSKIITVTTSAQEWEVSVSQYGSPVDWVVLTPIKGKTGESFTIDIKENPDMYVRDCIIKLIADNAEISINVLQQPYEENGIIIDGLDNNGEVTDVAVVEDWSQRPYPIYTDYAMSELMVEVKDASGNIVSGDDVHAAMTYNDSNGSNYLEFQYTSNLLSKERVWIIKIFAKSGMIEVFRFTFKQAGN